MLATHSKSWHHAPAPRSRRCPVTRTPTRVHSPPAARYPRRLVIDLHAHILPDVDDGPRTWGEALEILRAMAADGVAAVAATPHVRDDYPTTAKTMERLVSELRDRVANAGIVLEVLTGGEIALSVLDRLDKDELRRFGLGGNASCLLLEFPYYGWPLGLEDAVARLVRGGTTPVVAHPERSAEVQAAPERLRAAVEAGAFVQLTAASLDGRLGGRSRAAGLELLDLGLAHLVASDAHTPQLREAGLSGVARAVDDSQLAHWLAELVPAALVAGSPLPPRPANAAPKRRRFRFFRA
jgi:protein-tyrosine phosphatase